MTIRGKYIRLLRRTKRSLFICISIIAFFLFTIWSQSLEPFRQHNTVFCRYLRDNSSLPILARHLNLPPRSIFFHATSCPGNLTSRQHCAIESAARTHREWQINVVFSGPTFLKDYSHLKNVKLWRTHMEEFTKGTRFEKYIDREVFKKCRWNAELTKDVLKYLTLATWGGIYLDLDIVVARPLGSLARNWATRDDEGAIGDSVLALSRDSFGKNVSEIAVKEILSILKEGDCGSMGLPVITRVLRSYCTTADTAYMSSATCNGFEVYGPQFFHPIPKSRAREYFKPQELGTNNAYTYHLWDHVTKDYQVMRTSPLAKIARRYCPLTFKLYPDQFGFPKKDNKDLTNY